MFFYITRNPCHTPATPNTYIHFNGCGWYEDTDQSVHTYRPCGLGDYQMLYIKSGVMQFADERVGAGTLYLYRPHEPQDYFVAEKGTDYYWLHFSGTVFDDMFSNTHEHIFDIGYCEDIMRFCREVVMQYTDTIEENLHYIHGRLLSTVAALPPVKPVQKPDAINNAIAYIHEYYTSKLSNEELAKLCAMSKYHFIRRFTQKTGKTPQNYRTMLLVNKAMMMLTDTNMKIADIATTLGFEDSLYFSRTFKKACGISPTEYRKKH